MVTPAEKLIPMRKVPRHLQPPLDRTRLSTVFRWCLHGVGSPKVKLSTVKVGGRRFVTRAALDRFIAALSAGPSPAGTAAARTEQLRQAEDLLDAAGI